MVKKTIFIIISILSVITLIFIFGYGIKQAAYEAFPADGHILSQTAKATTTKYYFKSGTKYKSLNEKKIIFEDTNKEEVKIAKDSFVHYTNGAISTLKKAVILDLGTLQDKVFKYYSIFDGTILMKRNGQYSIKNGTKTIPFSSFVIKVSDNKYLFVADHMTLTIGEEQRKIDDNYLEITFVDGNITRIENQEVSLQNVSSNMKLTIGKVSLDLNNRNLFYQDERKLNLNQITIDSSDAIEIPKDAENTKMEEESKEEEATEEEENKVPNNPFSGIHNGVIDTEENTTEEIVQENARLKDPVFSVTSMEVSPYLLRTEIDITDKENLLSGDINIKIIETSSNKIVYQSKEMSGATSLQIENETLTPNTNYILIVNADYIKNDVTYNKDFVQKTFVTEAVGVDIEKNYASSSSLSFHVIKSEYSTVAAVDVELKDGDQVIEKQTVSLEGVTKQEVTFTELVNNKTYQVKMSNFIYENQVVSDTLTIEKSFQTLKYKPTFGLPSYTIDKKNGQFILKLNNIKDTDNGIKSYRYEIYDARSLTSGNMEPIQVLEKSTTGSVELTVDNMVIQRGVPYTFRVVTVFDDNEKEYEYETDYSEVMKMDGVEFPSVRFEEKKITFERIEGNIIISDPGSTINLDDGKPITLTYQDSVGNSNSITTNGNLTIPFSANNLRANETYTISLYAAINLQDGNPVIDNCFIGSVIVKTKDPNPFTLEYYINNEDTSRAFSISAQLRSNDGVSTALEASTLTGLKFNLYSGKNTQGALIKSVRKVDRNLEYYVSDLQSEYYDHSFEITPTIFGMRNQDMTSEYYTIEVTGAYDYTDFQNNLPIKNNVVTVKTNGYVPDVPTDPTKAIETNVIRNKDAGDRYQSDLEPDTVVGYRIKAGYDNSKKYAKTITYQLHNYQTKEVIATREYKIPADGSVDYVDFYLENGTSFGTKDKDFRRGNEYYFTYTAALDLNFDGTTETVYPTGDVVLSSALVSPKKQKPILDLYPSSSIQNAMTWKYHYEDVDSVLTDSKLYYRLGGTEKGSIALTTCSANEYKTITLNSLSPNFLTLYTKEALIKSNDNVKETEKLTQYYEGLYTPRVGQYHLSLETNHILISLLDYDTNNVFYQRVTSANVEFTSGSKTITKNNLLLDNGNIIVDLADLEEFLGQNISVKVKLIYDSGLSGFDITSDVAMQSIRTETQDSMYYTINDSGNLNTDSFATGSIFTKNFNIGTKNLTIKNKATGKEKTLKLAIDEKGVSYNYEYFQMKELKAIEVASDGSNNFSFQMIIPGISLTSQTGETNITATLVDARAKIKLYGVSSSSIKDNKIYLDLYQTDENATTSDFIKTITVNVSDLNNPVVIDGLQAKTNYYFKVFAEVKNGNSYEKTQLYDIDFQSNTKNYYFKTLGRVGISNVKAIYSASSYETRKLKISYDLDEIVGYDRLEYKIYKLSTNEAGEEVKELLDMNITPDTIFRSKMTKYIPIPVDCGFETGERYFIVIKPYASLSLDGEKIEVELENEGNYTYNFQQLYTPYVGVSSTIYSDMSLEFRINILDYQKVIVGGVYHIQVLDYNGHDITPSAYRDKEYDIKTVNNKIKVEGLEKGKRYTLKVICNVDQYNNSNKTKQYEKVYQVTTIDTEGINIGDVYATTNLEDQTKINLQFYNSYKLTSIDTIRYSIYDTSGFSSDNAIEFLPILSTASDVSFYSLTLPENITNYGIYYIQIQFLRNNNIIAEQSLEYRYIN